ncbi:lysozyme inhibitor LprI family protein [Gracilibacillus xinjiangensis]|uniref:Lysozyme inhibitor LprI family protein n=1 Tax=Gracilibacillus xinjiangensis TaxID=1193282 RepID=A0ABV8X0A5_9BACI
MINNPKFLIGMLTLFLVSLVACNPSDESSAILDNQSEKNNSAQNTNDDASLVDNKDASSNGKTDKENDETDEKAETPSNNPDKENSASLKEVYLQKLNETKTEMDKLRDNPEDSSTYALKNVESERFDVWDEMLNEVYGILEEQLPANMMGQLRQEQRDWIENRDNTAKEASIKYAGGTMEQLEYVAVMNHLTEERTFELVREYMK